MTWHVWRGAKASWIRCGKCGRRFTAGQRFARLASGLVRCESCYDDLQNVCPWPRAERQAAEEGRHVPEAGAVDYSSPSQPWATLGRQVADYKAKAARNE